MCEEKIYSYTRVSTTGKKYIQKCRKRLKCPKCSFNTIPDDMQKEILHYIELGGYGHYVISKLIKKKFPNSRISPYKVKKFLKSQSEELNPDNTESSIGNASIDGLLCTKSDSEI